MGPMFRITQLCDSRVLKILTLSESIDSNFDSGKMITLPHLVKLTFTTYRSAETSFLRCVSFPAIEDLHIISRSGNPLSTLTSAILRSGLPCRLKTLVLRTNTSSEALRDCTANVRSDTKDGLAGLFRCLPKCHPIPTGTQLHPLRVFRT
ncbi:hypothetical protein BDZ97DRAFT_768416 [Flammula alnicola]|nr:hypothetical protein BDZ97DRAFT_768416 [Flammula alnicola]